MDKGDTTTTKKTKQETASLEKKYLQVENGRKDTAE